jgi:hypothetical protein
MRRDTRMRIAAAGAAIAVLLSCSNPTSTREDAVVPLSDAVVDSLFAELVTLVESYESLDTASDYQAGKHAIMSKDFVSLRDGFATAPANAKANVGVIVSSILALNSSGRLEMLADSIDSYIRAMEHYYDSGGTQCMPKGQLQKSAGFNVPGLSRRMVDNHGLQGLATSILVQTPSMLKARAQMPRFPSLVTFSYLQQIVENDIMPALSEAIGAAGRLEEMNEWTVVFTANDELVEVDLGDVLMLDGAMRLLRGVCRTFIAFDMDIYTSATDRTYSWVSDMMAAMECAVSSSGPECFELRGDTLVSIETMDMSAPMIIMYRAMKYNLEERPAFMTLVNNSASLLEQDLRSAGTKLRSGLAAIRSETDDQFDDIISSLTIIDLDEEMFEIRDALIDEGLTSGLANKFLTPETLIDFLEELHNGPYTFNEVIDSYHINITIDLSVGFSNPVTDLRDLLPRYRWRPEAQWIERYAWNDDYVSEYSSGWNSIYLYGSLTDFDLSRLQPYIDSIVADPYYDDEWTVYLDRPYYYRVSADTMVQAVPLDLLDDNGNAMTPAVIDSLIEARAFFPYFDDYTMGGSFPGMTRQKWLDLVWQ